MEKKKKKKNDLTDFQKLNDFLKLNNKFKFRGKENVDSFNINSFKFNNIHKICQFLFSNIKKMDYIELIKLKKLFKFFNKKQLIKLSKNVKEVLNK